MGASGGRPITIVALRGGARGALRRGGAGAVIGQPQLEGALLQADDAVADLCSASAYTAAVTILAMWCARKLDGWKRELSKVTEASAHRRVAP